MVIGTICAAEIHTLPGANTTATHTITHTDFTNATSGRLRDAVHSSGQSVRLFYGQNVTRPLGKVTDDKTAHFLLTKKIYIYIEDCD